MVSEQVQLSDSKNLKSIPQMKNFICFKLNVFFEYIIYLKLQLNWKVPDSDTTGCLSSFRTEPQYKVPNDILVKHLQPKHSNEHSVSEAVSSIHSQPGIFPIAETGEFLSPYYPKTYLYPHAPKNVDFVSFMQSLAILL